ncbi:hypothetical protein K435DRAFT_469178 [Dendrothele bispora CBS 962.96]|uniref:Uncharacterized protein n=1 Tax=Dendrothele bispora (strain CBS 962.96) TaxID=1314807 RepID=A0A4V4HC41_DENBC|nr:hypothetical protein K435DRAFT_469178 [Dendrothele bispora CBS 962.96]
MSDNGCGEACGIILTTILAGFCQDWASIRHNCTQCSCSCCCCDCCSAGCCSCSCSFDDEERRHRMRSHGDAEAAERESENERQPLLRDGEQVARASSQPQPHPPMKT